MWNEIVGYTLAMTDLAILVAVPIAVYLFIRHCGGNKPTRYHDE